MPIYLVTGSPGSGKTYYTVMTFILDNLNNKRKVITNIRLFEDKLTSEQLEFYTYINPLDYSNRANPYFSIPDDFMDAWRNDQGQAPIFVIDECQKILSKTAKPSKELIEFLQEHRHFGEMDIVLVTQGQGYLHGTVKEMIEEHLYLQKMNIMGVKNRYFVQTYAGIKQRGKGYLKKKGKFNKAIFDVYKSHTQSETEVERDESRKVFNPFRFAVKFCIILFFCFVAYVYYGFQQFKKPKSQPIEKTIESYVLPDKSVSNANNVPIVSDSEFIGQSNTTSYYDYQNENYRPQLTGKFVVLTPSEVTHAPFFNYHINIKVSISSNKKALVYFDVENNKTNKRFMQTDKNLRDLGYVVKVLNNCLILLDHKYEQNPFYVHCEQAMEATKMQSDSIELSDNKK